MLVIGFVCLFFSVLPWFLPLSVASFVRSCFRSFVLLTSRRFVGQTSVLVQGLIRGLSSSQDGFFVGELMSGQRGLVPSNFVEKVAGKMSRRAVAVSTVFGISWRSFGIVLVGDSVMLCVSHPLMLYFLTDENDMNWAVNGTGAGYGKASITDATQCKLICR